MISGLQEVCQCQGSLHSNIHQYILPKATNTSNVKCYSFAMDAFTYTCANAIILGVSIGPVVLLLDVYYSRKAYAWNLISMPPCIVAFLVSIAIKVLTIVEISGRGRDGFEAHFVDHSPTATMFLHYLALISWVTYEVRFLLIFCL